MSNKNAKFTHPYPNPLPSREKAYYLRVTRLRATRLRVTVVVCILPGGLSFCLLIFDFYIYSWTILGSTHLTQSPSGESLASTQRMNSVFLPAMSLKSIS